MESTNAANVKSSSSYKPQLIFTDYGLGKFYVYNCGGKRHHIIEMNRNMYDYDRELFFWVLQHELNHNKFYQNPNNDKVKDVLSERKQLRVNKINYRMKNKLFWFQLKYPFTVINHYLGIRRFAVKENKQLLKHLDKVIYHKVKDLPPKEEVAVRMYLEGL